MTRRSESVFCTGSAPWSLQFLRDSDLVKVSVRHILTLLWGGFFCAHIVGIDPARGAANARPFFPKVDVYRRKAGEGRILVL